LGRGRLYYRPAAAVRADRCRRIVRGLSRVDGASRPV